MQVILRDDMDNLGKSGEVVNVKPGYGAQLPDAAGAGGHGDRRRRQARRAREARHRGAHRQAGQGRRRPRPTSCRRSRCRSRAPVGEEDKLYGSVTSRDIAEALHEKGVTVDSKKIHLAEPIKALGDFEVAVKLGRGVNATIKVSVVKKDA